MINFLRDKAVRLQNKFVLMSVGCPSEKKMERGDQIVEILGIIIVAVVILFLFRDKVKSIFETLLTTVQNNLNTLFNGNLS